MPVAVHTHGPPPGLSHDQRNREQEQDRGGGRGLGPLKLPRGMRGAPSTLGDLKRYIHRMHGAYKDLQSFPGVRAAQTTQRRKYFFVHSLLLIAHARDA